MQTQHLFFGAVFLIKVLSILLSFFLIDIREGEAFIFLWNLIILLLDFCILHLQHWLSF